MNGSRGLAGRRVIGRLLAVVAILSLTVPSVVVAAPAAPAKGSIDLPHVPGVVLVGFTPGASARERAAARARVGATARPISDLAPDAERWDLPHGLTTEAAIAALEHNPVLRYVEPNWIVTTAETSNDPYYLDGTLWGMYGGGSSPSNQYGSNAASAWSRGYVGSSDLYVGIIDTGVQFSHPDLADNFWTNTAEQNGTTGVDDDGNGKVDDLHGWDFYYGDATVFDADEHYHGTHVAGTIGGVGGNGLGVAGVNWRVKMISGKFLGPGGSGGIDAAAAAADYMTALKTINGLNIVATSNSWGGGGYSQTMLDAINRGGDAGILFIAAAGNGYSNNDASANYPSNYQCTTRKDDGQPRGWDCMVAVAAIDSTGAKASFSNWGATTVDLGAPGVGTRSTYPTDTYNYLSGTSMATPHVSGAAALCKSISPTISPSALRAALLNSVTPTASLAGITVTGGRLDVGSLVDACLPPTAPVDGSVTNVTVDTPTVRSLTVRWTNDSTNESAFEVQTAVSTAGVCGSYATVASAGANSTSAVIGGLTPSTDYCFRVRATNGYAGGTSTAWSAAGTGRTAAAPTPYVCSATTFAWVDASGGANLFMSDDSTVVRDLPAGFAFSSYGTTRTQVTISSNGFLRLGSATGSYYTNGPIPSSTEPNGVIAAAWDDWNPSAGGTVSTLVSGTSPARRYVVTWTNVPHYNVTGSTVTFQAILEEGGDAVTYQYLDMTTGSPSYDGGMNATAGIESLAGDFGTQLSYNQALLTDGKAYRCSADAGTTPAVATGVLPDGGVGKAYSALLTATDGTAPYAWSLEGGALPDGLALSSDGTISGTPTTPGAATFTVRVTDGAGRSGTGPLTITVNQAPAVTTTSIPAATYGAAYSATLAATGGAAPYSWSLVTGPLPSGIGISSAGVISGSSTASGTYPLTIRVMGTNGANSTASLSLVVTAPPAAITTSTLAAGTVGSFYSALLAATDGSRPYTWVLVSGTLPGGLALDASTGVIEGTPNAAGTSSFTVGVSGPDGAVGTRALSISVGTAPSVSTSSLTAATAGVSYGVSVTGSGGTTPYTWSASGLPSGLTMSTAGRISGTATESGTFSVTLSLVDAFGRTASRAVSLTVGFGKLAPASGVKLARTSSTTLSWSAHPAASGYEYCFASGTKACSTWVAAAGTSVTVAVAPGGSYNWQVRAQVSGTWVTANNGSGWKFSVSR